MILFLFLLLYEFLMRGAPLGEIFSMPCEVNVDGMLGFLCSYTLMLEWLDKLMHKGDLGFMLCSSLLNLGKNISIFVEWC